MSAIFGLIENTGVVDLFLLGNKSAYYYLYSPELGTVVVQFGNFQSTHGSLRKPVHHARRRKAVEPDSRSPRQVLVWHRLHYYIFRWPG